ncbi:hypothetical protein CFC21_059687 [Triticum aestivum]|uniref:Uncharacterized protein n=3 Tax=Triticum TaxID=4564 RepID=A0A9R0WI75_TRITD|nr:uncharacterized protein LOC119292223 [Triticum dicoccoides]XP_044371927.1 uncharacterized protein LOC123093929 [Triticum aestivum]KAF7051450.1 hypothetical protein CFC21_059687 [Triticum aestivum]VAI11322.1 unnamed protein product [Triticum turgidum subsp. durum]
MAAAAAAGQQQRVVVMRHGDRLDHAEPMWPANKPRPWDPPLTDAGVLRAWTVGKRIRAQAAADGYALHRVLVSPFRRCLQTAAQAVAALCAVPDDAALAAVLDPSANVPLEASRVKVSIEYGLSEMMNVEAMGAIVSQIAPGVEKWFPDLAELEAILPPGTIDHSTEPLFSEVPKWGESVRGARIRYASLIKALADKYPDENLLLVTHGEGVGSSVACFGATGMEVYEVEYCAYTVLEKQPSGEGGGDESVLKVVADRSGPTTGIHYLVT